ncbi:MAG: energy transducer TonB [Longimicrobiaceae bacterium]
MWMRRAIPVMLLLLAPLLSATPGRAQRATSQERALARSWRTAGADSVALDRLFQATLRTGGPELFDAVLAAARDPERPPLVRVYALAALFAYARPEYRAKSSRVFLWAARDVGIACEPLPAWAPGDTLRACARTGSSWEIPPVRPGDRAPPAALSADSARVEAIVAVAREIARGGRSAVAGAADMLLAGLGRFSNVRSVPACPSSFPALPPLSDTRSFHQERARPAMQAPTLVNACTISLQLARNYPPLARDNGEEGTVVLSLLVGPGGEVREASVERGAPRPDFDAAALRVVSRMRFTPARRGSTPVAARVSLPIRFMFASAYPRVPYP